MAKVCSFYGWTFDYASKLNQDIFWNFYYCVDIIEAEKEMADIRVISYPHIKDTDRNKILRTLRNRASAQRESQVRTLTPEELAYNDAKESLENGQRENRN